MNVFNLNAAIGIDTTEYEKELQKSHGLAESFGSKLGSVFSSAASKVGELMTKAASEVSGFLTDAVKTGADFDTAMSQVAATMRTSVSEIDELREFAMKMGAETAFSATEAAEAMNYLALAGYDAETQMGMLPKVLDLAAAGSIGLADAANMLTTNLNAFGFDVTTEQGLERATALIDEMAVTAGTTSTDIAQLGASLSTLGALAGDMRGGYIKMSDGSKQAVDGVLELETAFGLMANAGITASEAGTHMRNMIMKMTSGADDIKEALGVDVFDEATHQMRSLKDIFSDLSKVMFAEGVGDDQRFKWLSDLFNTRDTAALEAVLKNVGDDWDRIGEGLVESAGAAEKMKNEQLNNLAGDTKLFSSAVETLKIRISDALNPALRTAVQFATDFVSNFDIQPITDALSAFAEGAQGYLTAFQEGGFSGVLDTLGADIDAFARKIERFDLKELFDSADFSGFTDNLQKIGEIGSRLVSAIGTAIVNNAGAIGDSVIPLLTSLGNALTDTSRYSQYVDMAKGAISNFCDGLLKKENIDLFFSEDKGIPKILANIVTNLGTGISAVITAAGDILGKILGYMVNPENQETLKNGAEDILVALGEGLLKVTDAMDNSIIALMKIIAMNMGAEFDGTEAGEEIAMKLLTAIWQKIKEENIFKKAWDWIAGESDGQWAERWLNDTETRAVDVEAYKKEVADRAAYQARITEQSIRDAGAIEDMKDTNSAVYNAWLKSKGYYATGGIVTRPTYALIGESGAEAVMPLEHNTGWIRQLAQELGGGSQTVIQFGDIYVTGGEDAGHQVAEQIDRALRDLQIQQARGIGGTAWKQ